MKKMIMNYMAAAAASVLLAGSATASVILEDWQDGTSGHEYTGWNAGEPFGNVALPPGFDLTVTPTTGGAITMGTDSEDYTIYGSLFYTADLNGGLPIDMTAIDGDPGLTFQFQANTAAATAPVGLGFYFQSTVGPSDSYWFYDISSVGSPNVLNTYEVSLGSDTGWSGYTGITTWGSPTGVDFASALSEVTAIGMFVYSDITTAQSYQFANIGYGIMVPEPETYLALGVALLSLVVVFRKRITESLAQARALTQS